MTDRNTYAQNADIDKIQTRQFVDAHASIHCCYVVTFYVINIPYSFFTIEMSINRPSFLIMDFLL